MGFPCIRYHKEKYPEGKVFRSQEELPPPGTGWVESPEFDQIAPVEPKTHTEVHPEPAPEPIRKKEKSKSQDSKDGGKKA
jgi:hypothetical protein